MHSRGRRAGDVMTRQVISIGADRPLDEIVTLMIRDGLKRLPVVRDKELVGIVSPADLLAAFLRRVDEQPQFAVSALLIRRHILREISGKRWAPHRAVNFAVREGVVELTGTAASEHMRNAIRIAAESAPGVKQVIDDRLAKRRSGQEQA